MEDVRVERRVVFPEDWGPTTRKVQEEEAEEALLPPLFVDDDDDVDVDDDDDTAFRRAGVNNRIRSKGIRNEAENDSTS